MHAHEQGEAAFYSRKGSARARFFERCFAAARRGAGSGVGERFAETRLVVFQFAGFEDFAAVQALHVLRVFIFGDELRSFVLAGGIGC